MKPSRNTEDTANETPQQPYLGAIIHSIILARLLLDKHSSRPGRVYKEEHTEVAPKHMEVTYEHRADLRTPSLQQAWY